MEHLARPGRHGKQRVVAAHVGVSELAAALLGQAVGLADRRVEVDGEGRAGGAGAAAPGAGEEAAADGARLARVAEAEGAQEGAERGGRAQLSAEHGRGGTGAQARRVVDAVAAGERGVDEGECLEAGARGADRKSTRL